ncbi:hypothetical protein [Kribbella italica]|uniref:Uncharacterized protein n=1 Tax=Kribbella italica TaxID=1540520 RepID=A0A7W9MY96_9ACTN|nr:hypothetical protein [Kribbella italica]MBB5840180.1 hypothetical protein [Kribbella italica]
MTTDDPDGPPVVTRQLQLELEGIDPLTDEQRVEAWLREQGTWSADARAAALYLRDRRSRRTRATRWEQLQAIQAPFESEWGWLTPGGEECIWLYHEAERSYVDGLHLASLLCAHAACERVLAGCLLSYEQELPKGWRFWGLGPLVKEAFLRKLIDSPLRDSLAEINEIRKVSAHFKPPLEANSVSSRAYHHMQATPDLNAEEAIDQVAQGDALMAFRAATELMRGDQGFARVRLY